MDEVAYYNCIVKFSYNILKKWSFLLAHLTLILPVYTFSLIPKPYSIKTIVSMHCNDDGKQAWNTYTDVPFFTWIVGGWSSALPWSLGGGRVALRFLPPLWWILIRESPSSSTRWWIMRDGVQLAFRLGEPMWSLPPSGVLCSGDQGSVLPFWDGSIRHTLSALFLRMFT